MSVTPARWAALDALRAVREGELLDRALARVLGRVTPRDRAWTQELVYGVVRLRGRLDYMLDRWVRRGIVSLDADVLDTLRLGAYQLVEMGSVPAYAAVSQSVEMAKAVAGKGAGGLVNGVLQTLRRRGGEVRFPDFRDDPAAHLTTHGSHPRWLVERWIRRYGADAARRLVEANNTRPDLYIRPVTIDVGEAGARLAAAGIEAQRVDFAPDALRLVPPATAAAALAVVPAVVQDPAAGLVVRYAELPDDARVLDLCAAPGGKAVELAERARYTVAADVSVRRLERVRENVDRVGGLRIGLVAADARWPPFTAADAVLLDVPCTGTGTLRRHPDGRWRLRPTDLAALVELQRSILDAAAPLVRRGGLLVYSTCSLEPEENEEQVEAFLRRHAEFGVAAPSPGTIVAGLLDAAGRLSVVPHEAGVDGAFAVRLRREM